MGKDNQPKVRQANKLARKEGLRWSYNRILIVTEGLKTEPLYLNEIRVEYRLSTINVQVQPSQFGTTPLQVVEYAEHLFLNGDDNRSIQPHAFEEVYAVFDRDDHTTYHNALGKAKSLEGKLHSDLNQVVHFEAIASVPCFELWLLLHFENVLAPLHRTEVYQRLNQFLSGYDKGQAGHFAQTRQYLDVATQKAVFLAAQFTPYDGTNPYTDIHRLVTKITKS